MTDVDVLVVGAGFSGIGTAIKLKQAGITDYVVVETGDGVGGTWHWNTYPGIAVDIPSFSYQFSFAQRSTWSRSYAKGAELKAYAEQVVDDYGVRDHFRFHTFVERAEYDDDTSRWVISTSKGEYRARYLINGSGVLTVPNLPDIPGVEDFAGITMHTARWDHDVSLAGKRVAIIGTGASAIQVIPEIAPEVASLSVFQRTPIWCFPKPDLPLPLPLRLALKVPGAKSVTRLASQAFVELTFPVAAQFHSYFPLASQMETFGKAWLRSQVKDPETRAALTPVYGVGCKRPSFHNSYLSTYNRDNVALVTDPITEITPTGVRTADGREHEIDVLILATGFKVMDAETLPTFDLIGTGGQTLGEFWSKNRLQAYEGVSIPGFPNFFTVFGPYGYNGSSYFALIEAQVHHIVRCLKHAQRKGAERIEVRTDAHERYFDEMLSRRHTQVFWQDSCASANSYYFDSHGDVPLRRSTTVESLWHSRTFNLDDYAFSS